MRPLDRPPSKLIDSYYASGRKYFDIKDPKNNMKSCLQRASKILHEWKDGRESRAEALDAIVFLEHVLGYQVKRCTDRLRLAVSLDDEDGREQLFAEAVAGIRFFLRRNQGIFAYGELPDTPP